MKFIVTLVAFFATIAGAYLLIFYIKHNSEEARWKELREYRRTEFTMRVAPDYLRLIEMLNLGNCSTMKYLDDFDSYGTPFQVGTRGVIVEQPEHSRLASWEIRARYQGMNREPSYLTLDVDLDMALVRDRRRLTKESNKYVLIDQTGIDAKECGTRERGGVTVTTTDIAKGVRRVRFESAWPPAMLMTAPPYNRGYADLFYCQKLPQIYGLLCTHILSKGTQIAFEPAYCGQPGQTSMVGQASGYILNGQKIIGLVRISGSKSSYCVANVECYSGIEDVFSTKALKESKLDTEFNLADGISYIRRTNDLTLTIGPAADIHSVSDRPKQTTRNAPAINH